MNLRQMEVFVTVAELKGFAPAEDVLYISRQGIKKQIDSLEQEIGVCLLERTHHGCNLTEYGSMFYTFAKNTLSEKAKIISDINMLSLKRGSITVLNFPHPRNLLENVFAEFTARYPQAKLNIVYSESINPEYDKGYSDDTIVRVLTGDVDIAEYVYYEGQSVLPPELCFYKIYDQRFYCLMQPDNALANCKSISIDQLRGQDVHIYSTKNGILPAEVLADTCQHFEKHQLAFGNTADIFTACHNGGIWISKAHYVHYLPPLVAIPFEYDCKGSSIGIIFKKNYSVRVKKFVDLVKELY